ncbi:hypothetical protein HPP92_025918 [Vanilla planifolia]|uniref:Uncharacterized protein n=1 Tax=Vanilla planifolia TaxID=51239 RepID=A0A835PK48_VANPL|nr:hypothetical protein HPP92_025918 [Vanilla planifolia]
MEGAEKQTRRQWRIEGWSGEGSRHCFIDLDLSFLPRRLQTVSKKYEKEGFREDIRPTRKIFHKWII